METITFIIRQMLNFAIPLLIVALGSMFSSRSGVINIGLDGIMIMGAFTSIIFIRYSEGIVTGQTQLFVALLIALVTGILVSALHAFASIT